jgi:hypothetical protein
MGEAEAENSLLQPGDIKIIAIYCYSIHPREDLRRYDHELFPW